MEMNWYAKGYCFVVSLTSADAALILASAVAFFVVAFSTVG